jgi:hypothetical protein
VACSGYCYGVDTWNTLLIVISFSTCTCQHYRLIVAKKILNCKKQVATICVIICSWTIVENVVAKGGVFLLVDGFFIMTHGAIEIFHMAYQLNLSKINVNQYLNKCRSN